MGNFNIDLLKTDSDHSVSKYRNNPCYSFFAPSILQPTRVPEESKTLIDNIAHKISVHLIQLVLLEDFFILYLLKKITLLSKISSMLVMKDLQMNQKVLLW